MRNIYRKQCHIIFHSFSFVAINFECGAETAFYVFRGKVYLLFFRNFRRHFPDFEQPFLRKDARTGFHVISDTFCKKRQKTSILRLLTGFQEPRTIFRKGWQNHFQFVQGPFLETKFFLQKTYTMKILTFSSKKLPSLRKKIPQCWGNCFWWAGRNNVEKNNFSKKKLFALKFVTDFGLEFCGSFPEVAFCIFKNTLRVESADRKKGTINFVFEIWYKNLRTFSESFPQGYLYCILVVQRHFLGENEGKIFLIISIFWVCAEIFRQVVRIRFH